MKTLSLALALALLFTPCIHAASLLERLGLKRAPSNPAVLLPASLSQEEIVRALKEALGQGVARSVAMLGQEDGFLKDVSVKIPVPDNLLVVERTLRSLRQERLSDEFVKSLNRAAEQAIPAAVPILAEAIQQMTLADAKSILTGPDNAATRHFQRTSEETLFERFLPIVQSATEQAGVTRAYKTMTAMIGTRLRGMGDFGGKLPGGGVPDLDSYVTRKALEGLFLKVAEQEKQIRENPAARTTDLLRQVFGALGK